MTSQLLLTSKRGPSAPLSGSSSSEGEGSDHEDVPASPCSSTSSGPTYDRPPGFTHHGQEILIPKPRGFKLKKRIKRQSLEVEGFPHAGGVVVKEEDHVSLPAASQTAKTKQKRDPLPMKLRALPQSFWQQPNSVNAISPGSMYSVLPPLCKSEHSNLEISVSHETRPCNTMQMSFPEIGDPRWKRSVGTSNAGEPSCSGQAFSPICSMQLTPVINTSSASLQAHDFKVGLTRPELQPISPPSSDDEKEKVPTKTSPSSEIREQTEPKSCLLSNNNISIRDLEKDKVSPEDKSPSCNINKEPSIKSEIEVHESPVVVRRRHTTRPAARIVKVSPASQQLLMKLFEGVEGEKKKVAPPVRRGRPRREPVGPTTSKHMIRDDPYMIDAVEGLLPLLSLETSKQSTAPSSQLALVALKAGDKTLTLPSLSIEQNYPAVLSELVKAL